MIYMNTYIQNLHIHSELINLFRTYTFIQNLHIGMLKIYVVVQSLQIYSEYAYFCRKYILIYLIYI